MDNLFLIESCLNHARYHGHLPSHVDVQGVMKGLLRTVAAWTTEQRAKAMTWRGRCPLPSTDPAPDHVAVLIQRAIRAEVA